MSDSNGPLSPDVVPVFARHLLPLAETWGIGDDFDRSGAVEVATDSALHAMVAEVDAAPDEFWHWLAGPESYVTPPTREYIALTDLTQAADLARIVLRRRSSSR